MCFDVVTVFKAKKSEMEWVIERSGPNQTQSCVDSVVRLRGLPFDCTKEEITRFFAGMSFPQSYLCQFLSVCLFLSVVSVSVALILS